MKSYKLMDICVTQLCTGSHNLVHNSKCLMLPSSHLQQLAVEFCQYVLLILDKCELLQCLSFLLDIISSHLLSLPFVPFLHSENSEHYYYFLGRGLAYAAS